MQCRKDCLQTFSKRLITNSETSCQFNNRSRQPFKGTEDETVRLTSQSSVRQSTPVGKTITKAEDTGIIQHQTDHSTSQKNSWDATEDSSHSSSRLQLSQCHRKVPYQQRQYRKQLLQDLQHFHQVPYGELFSRGANFRVF